MTPPSGTPPDPNGSWPPPPQAPQGYYAPPPDNTLGGLIPTKNSAALIAYYLGIFSFIPCLGLPLGIAALVLGLRGLRYVRQYPAARGRTHAWVGIIAGGLFGCVYLALALMVLYAFLTHARTTD